MGLPTLALAGLPVIQFDVEDAGPEAPGAVGVVGGKLDKRNGGGHAAQDSGNRSSVARTPLARMVHTLFEQ
jgi:hypothetical protein